MKLPSAIFICEYKTSQLLLNLLNELGYWHYALRLSYYQTKRERMFYIIIMNHKISIRDTNFIPQKILPIFYCNLSIAQNHKNDPHDW